MGKDKHKEFVIKEIVRLKKAFPSEANTDAFFAALAGRIIANGFTEEETIRIIDNAIVTIEHPQLTIAEVIHEYKKEKQSHICD